MISKLDDYPIHQTVEPVAQTATSDRFTYDRFWYNGHAKDSAFYFGIGLCRYPNLGIVDCSFSVVVDGRQYAFHGSRRASDEPMDLDVGPFKLSILEPMGRHRLVIESNDTNIECDLVFTPKTGVIPEGRQTLRNARHVVMDATRIDQFGHWQGSISVEGRKIAVNSETTFGLKDRSWGIRPVGAPYEGGAPLDSFQAVHFMWLPIHWENRCTLAGWFEDDSGYQWHTDQAIAPIHAEGESIPVNDPAMTLWQGCVGHQLKFKPGTRQAESGTFLMNHKNGEQIEITVQPVLLHRMKGLGYMHPEWGHGKWHGELVIAGESWNCDDAPPLNLENIHIQQTVVARCGDEVGYGVLEELHIGPHAELGFKDWFDGAE